MCLDDHIDDEYEDEVMKFIVTHYPNPLVML